MVTILDEMCSEAIRGFNVIKHHDICIAVRDRAVNNHERKVEVSSGEVGNALSCWRENHSRDIFISLQVEVDRFLLRVFIRIAQEDAEALLIGDIFDGPADRGKKRVANVGLRLSQWYWIVGSAGFAPPDSVDILIVSPPPSLARVPRSVHAGHLRALVTP